MIPRLCVEWMDRRTGQRGWCAVPRGRLDPKALSDKTICGAFVTMRIGSETRVPTCEECLKTLRARRAAEGKRYRLKKPRVRRKTTT